MPTSSTDPTPDAHPGVILATLALANVMGLLDQFVVNVALHDIGADFHHSLSDVAWVLSAYSLFFGALLVPAGRLADKFGLRITFILGLTTFALASLGCAVSPELVVLIAFRCIQAIGAAMLIPSSLGLVLTVLPPERVKSGVRLWAVSGAFAGVLGPVVGGLLTSLSWRWIFVINVPIGLAAIVITWRLIPNVRHDTDTKMPDPLGSAMAIIGVGALSLALLNGQNWGWGSGRVAASWVVAAAAIVIFVISTARAKVPVVDLHMFHSRVFSSANVAAMISAVVFAIQLLALSFFFEQSWHWSVIDTGLGLAPGPATVLIGAPLSEKLAERIPVGVVTALGLLGFVGGGQLLMLLLLHAGGHGYALDIMLPWCIVGVGYGFSIPTIIGSATHDLPAAMSATGSAVVNSGRQIGSVIGTAILVVVLGTAAVSGHPTDYYHLWWVAIAACAAGAAASLGLTPSRTPLSSTVAEASPAGLARGGVGLTLRTGPRFPGRSGRGRRAGSS